MTSPLVVEWRHLAVDGETCDKRTAGLIHVRELPRIRTPESDDTGTTAVGAECGQAYAGRKGQPGTGNVQPDSSAVDRGVI